MRSANLIFCALLIVCSGIVLVNFYLWWDRFQSMNVFNVVVGLVLGTVAVVQLVKPRPSGVANG